MKRFTIRLFGTLTVLLPYATNAQILFADDAVIFVNPGANLHCNGGIVLTNGTALTNNGVVRSTKNSGFSSNGNFEILSSTVVNGNGNYWVEQDWINNASFIAGGSTVNLYGNTEQFITSSNGTITEFNNLSLLGSGTGTNRKKSLQAVNARISLGGILALNDRELATSTNSMTVLNPSPLAVTSNLSFGNEGFVSSLAPGYLVWKTNSTGTYYFPLGSSDGTLRFRPIAISPYSSAAHTFNARLNNFSADLSGYNLNQHESIIISANDLFYHSIQRSAGASSAALVIAYDDAEDGDWSGIAQWSTNSGIWESISADNTSVLGNYKAIEHSNWTFANPEHPYTLINLGQELIIPNVFTPNEDGTNDLYFIKGVGITEFNMTIVNRWGNPVFETNDINTAWDGRSGGKMCEDGTYYYVIQAKSLTQEFNKHGFITLKSH